MLVRAAARSSACSSRSSSASAAASEAGKQWWSWVSLDDLVAALPSRALESDLAGAVNLTSPNPVTNAQFTKALGQGAQPADRRARYPHSLRGRSSARWGEEMLLGGQRVLPARLLDAGFEFSAPTIEAGIAQALAD